MEAGQSYVVDGIKLEANFGAINGTTGTKEEFVTLLDSSNNTVKTVQSNNDCEFSFNNLEAGTYSLTITKDGFYSTTLTNIVVVSGEYTVVSVPALSAKYGSATGKIVISGSSSFANANVTLTYLSDTTKTYSTTTSYDGIWSIDEIINAGQYSVTVSKDGYVTDVSKKIEITLGSSTTVEAITLTSVLSTIKGSVTIEGASTYEGVTLLLKSTEDETLQYDTSTDTKGAFVLSKVNPGQYTLIASKAGYVSKTITNIVVGPSEVSTLDDIALEIGVRSVTGKVKLELASDYSLVLVTATNLNDTTIVYSAVTNSAGEYTLAGMQPGEYSIVISYSGYRTETLATVNVITSTVTNITLTEMNINRGTITGVAKLEERSSSSGIKVELLRGSTVYEETSTDESGNYTFYVPQGNYTGVRYTSTDFASVSVSKDIALFADNYISMGDTTLKATHNSVYGTVDVLTTEVESAVTISFDGVTTIEKVVTEADGSFRFDHVPVGNYVLRFQRQDCSDITIPVEVKASDGINLGKIEITPNTATIKGKVNLENGISLSGVKVSVALGTKVLETLTDDSGRYEIGGVSIADEYTVTYSKDGWDSKTQKISPKLNILEVRELDEITLVDATVPVLSNVVINSGANTTANKNITLNLTASDEGSGLSKIMVTYDNVFDKATRQYDYSAIFNWELPVENGVKTIYVKVVDRAGNESASFTASVTLTDQKTEVSGVLSGDELTWTKEKSPYLVVGSVMVEEGTTLTIEPGVDVQFAGNYGITVEGTIKAIGTEAEKISFYGIDEGENNWICINCKYNNNNMLQYVNTKGSLKGLQGYMTVLNASLTSNNYVFLDFVGEICNSTIDGSVYVKSSSLLNNTFTVRTPLNESVCEGYSYYEHTLVQIKNGIIDSYLTGTVFNGDSVCIGGVSENNVFTGMTVYIVSSCSNTTFESCNLYLKDCVTFYNVGSSDSSDGSAIFKCVFEDCEFCEFNPTLVRDSNFIDCGNIQINTKYSSYEEVDLTSNFWGYANTAELNTNGLKKEHSFIKDYYADSEFSITKANLSNYREEPNADAGYTGDIYYSYPVESTIEYAVGSAGPAGGIIFYDKGYYSNGWRYLEVSPSDITTSATTKCVFDCYEATANSDIRATGTSTIIGSGKINTEMLVETRKESAYNKSEDGGDITSDYAAKKCLDYTYGGYDDWFLPSKEELNLIYVNLYKQGLGSFASNGYWSSSESDCKFAWYQDFSNGNQSAIFVENYNCVRPIRAF